MIQVKENRVSLNLWDNETVKWEYNGKQYCLHVQSDDSPNNPREEDGIVTVMACWHRRYNLGDKTGAKEPKDFWQELVRNVVPQEEVLEAALAGKLRGIRLAECEDSPELVDIYETYYLRTILGNSEPRESLEYEGVPKDSVSDYLMDDLTIGHCQTLLSPYLEWLPLWLYDHSGITMSCGTRVYPYNDRWDSGQVGWIVAMKETVIREACATEETWRERSAEIMRGDVELYDNYLTGNVYGFTLYEAESGNEDPEWVETDSCWGFYGPDIIESGLADQVGCGLIDAIASDEYEIGKAKRYTRVYYTF